MSTRIARRRAGVALTAILAFALTGCQSLGDGGAGDPPTDDDVVPGGTPAVAGAPVLQLSSRGGFSMIGYDFSAPPTLTVYDDGRAVVPGPQIAIYPAPVLPNLQVEQLSADDLDALVAAARDAGLLADPPDYGMPNVTDLPTTYLTLTVDGRTVTHAAYALGIVDGESATPEGALARGDSGLTDAQAAARQTLAQFIATANDLVGATGAGELYAIEAFGVFAWPIDASVEGAVAPDVQVLPWPLDVALADMTQCTLVDGDAAQTLLATLAGANQATVFTQDDVTYTVWFRPLLPHEAGCEALA